MKNDGMLFFKYSYPFTQVNENITILVVMLSMCIIYEIHLLNLIIGYHYNFPLYHYREEDKHKDIFNTVSICIDKKWHNDLWKG